MQTARDFLCRATPAVAKPSKELSSMLSNFVSRHGGDRPLQTILLANNGMAAMKFIRSVRQWSIETFGTDRVFSLVALATPEDIRMNAEHVRLADQFVEVPGGPNTNNYSNVKVILRAA